MARVHVVERIALAEHHIALVAGEANEIAKAAVLRCCFLAERVIVPRVVPPWPGVGAHHLRRADVIEVEPNRARGLSRCEHRPVSPDPVLVPGPGALRSVRLVEVVAVPQELTKRLVVHAANAITRLLGDVVVLPD